MKQRCLQVAQLAFYVTVASLIPGFVAMLSVLSWTAARRNATALVTGIVIGGGYIVSSRLIAAFERSLPRLAGHAPIVAGPRSRRRRWNEIIAAVVVAGHSLLFLLAMTVLAFGALALTAPWWRGPGPFAAGPFTIASTSDRWAAFAAGIICLASIPVACVAAATSRLTLVDSLLGNSQPDAVVIDLTRSRRRILDTYDAERARIERDLHDGAQQHLVALAMQIDLATIELETGDITAAKARLTDAKARALQTTDDLRTLIRNVHPPLLREQGLAAAIRQLATGTPVTVDTTINLAVSLDPATETAAYFIAAETITNAVRHANPTRIKVHCDNTQGPLLLSIEDNGHGGALPVEGHGLTGLADRVAALDGQLTITSPPGGPTIITATLPGTIRSENQ